MLVIIASLYDKINKKTGLLFRKTVFSFINVVFHWAILYNFDRQ